jgi:hypothetical protein
VFPLRYGLDFHTFFRENSVFKALVDSGSNTFTLRCESEATKREPSAWGYNWATLYLGDINTGTWSSMLRETRL